MKIRPFIILCAMGFLLFYYNPIDATTQHVYPGDSIQTAINNAGTGDTILVHTGTYTEQLTINKSLTIRGEEAGPPVIQSSSGLVLIEISGPGIHVDFSGFEVKHTGTANWSNSYAVIIQNGAYAHIHHINLVDFKKRGIYVLGNSSSADITDNSIIAEGSPNLQNGIGIWGSGGGFAHILNNEVAGVLYGGTFWSATGIMALDTYDKTVIIGENYVHDCQLGMGIGDYCGYNPGSHTSNVLVRGNIITKNSWGVDIINDARGVTLVYNTISNNSEYGISVTDYVDEGWSCEQPTDTLINYNTISGNGTGLYVNARVDLVDARYNCWGDWTGPRGGVKDPDSGTIARGSGDSIVAESSNSLFYPWTPCGRSNTPEKQPAYGKEMCPLAYNNIQQAESMEQSVMGLMDEVLGDFDLTEVEQLIQKAHELLEKARLFCFHSQNCIAGNMLALEAHSLLQQAKEILESMIT